ncbi:MAG: cation transporter [Fimbriimonadaceae bacterium]|nr:MAG: cation transporter [Fimbriimonadaceae bacterium]
MSDLTRAEAVKLARHSVLVGVFSNGALAIIKGAAGVLGHSQALIADAVESSSDVLSSLVVFFGLKVAAAAPSQKHPYGKGRAEPMAAAVIAIALFIAAIAVAVSSVHEIVTPHLAPAPFTLVVLVGVVAVKEGLFRFVRTRGKQVRSLALEADAWHHRSDAITSLAALLGISIALIGGKGWEAADDWAALVAAGIMMFNAWHLLKPALSELTDAVPDQKIVAEIRDIAYSIKGVKGTHRCWVRKLGLDYFVDLDVLVDGELTVREGHDLAHAVHDAVTEKLPFVRKVMVHVEPTDEFGRHKLDWED